MSEWKKTPCILWTGARSRNGYGNLVRDGKWIGAHRAAYQDHIGPIPPGRWVLHRCDVRLCVNAAHLFLGTARDNSQDMAAKGRAGDMRLTRQAVLAMRSRHAAGESFTQLARAFGVSIVSARNVVVRRTWAWL